MRLFNIKQPYEFSITTVPLIIVTIVPLILLLLNFYAYAQDLYESPKKYNSTFMLCCATNQKNDKSDLPHDSSSINSNAIHPIISDDAVAELFVHPELSVHSELSVQTMLSNNNSQSRFDDQVLAVDGEFDNDFDSAMGDSGDEFLDDFEAEFQSSQQSKIIGDPLYYYNYLMYSFNDVLYFVVLKPVTSAYKALTPACFRMGVDNFFVNLLFPLRFVNNLLQGKMTEAGREVGIFLINSTIGAAGFVKVAQNEFDLHISNEDFRQTLGYWSIGHGFYLVLPVIGSSTFRDTIGLAANCFLSPVNYINPLELSYGLWASDLVNTTSFRLEDYEILKKAAFDPYTALKAAYLENMEEKIAN